MSNAPAVPRQKAPRRTAERILETSLALFNRYGEPNASTNMIAAELNISPGNLYYHYPAKEALVNTLVDRFEHAMQQVLAQATGVRHLDGAGSFLGLLMAQIWDYRFLYRDLSDLLTRNRQLEQRLDRLFDLQQQALEQLVQQLQQTGTLRPVPAEQRTTLATNLVLLLSYWLSYEYARHPRSALEPQNQDAAITRGTAQALALLLPWQTAARPDA